MTPTDDPTLESKPQRDGIIWRLFPDVRRRERERFVFFALLSGLITLAQTIGLAGSDALFLSGPGPQALPATFILASAVSVTGSLAYALVVGRVRNDKLYALLLVGSAAVLLAGVPFALIGARWVLYGFFVAAYATQGVLLYLHYWTFATDYFDTLSSKRVFPYLVVSGSLGGILGGALSVFLSRVAGTESLILTWALFLLGAAVLVHRSGPDLKRWFPVGDEADESSAEGMRAALRFVRRSPLARWLTLSVVGMVLALFLLQFLEMQIFTEAFQSPEALASFFGIYLAVTNGIEILVARVVTPALLRRFGIATANLVHPVLTLLTFAALAVDPRLYVAILARANRELMDNSLAGPIRSLSYNALPFRFRGRMRAFLEGIVFYAAMSIAGAALLLIDGRLDHRALCLVGIAAAGVYGFANLRVRREYLRSLVGELRSGRLDLQAVGADLGELEVSRLAEQWQLSLASESEPPRGWLDLPPLFARHGVTEPLRRNASHAHAGVRVACLEALASVEDPDLPELLRVALEDPEPSVRLSAARAAAAVPDRPASLEAGLRGRLEDPDARVRAEAALRLSSEGLQTLRHMASADDQRTAIEALDRLPAELIDEARTRLDDEDAGVQATALSTVTRLADAISLTPERLERSLAHPDYRVRGAACRALGERHDETSAALLAGALDDVNREVRATAAACLAAMGEIGVRAARRSVESIRRWTVDAALLAVARGRSESSRAILEQAFRVRVREAWESLAALQLVPAEGDLALRFLHTALENARQRSTSIAFRTLELMEDPLVVRSVRKTLDADSERRRADALEVLSNLGDRESSHQLALLLEDGPVADKLPAVSHALTLPTELQQVVQQAQESPDRWLKLAVASHPTASTDGATPEVRTMESLLALRRVPLFAHLSLEQLEAIGQFMHEEEYMSGEVVVREGQPGEELYVILEGEARAFKHYGTPNETPLTTMSPSGVGYFGEIAIFDRAPRSATVVITEDARLLTLAGSRFMELILQSPEISFEVFKVLTQRLRQAEERLRAQEDQDRDSSK
jgi:HEAT repeat protein